jgi:hypothetical protein
MPVSITSLPSAESGEGSTGGPTYRSPPLAWRLPVAAGLGAMLASAASTGADRWLRAHAPLPMPPRQTIQLLVAITAAVHVAEATAVAVVATRRGIPDPTRWALGTLMWGFPTMLRLRAADPQRPDR